MMNLMFIAGGAGEVNKATILLSSYLGSFQGLFKPICNSLYILTTLLWCFFSLFMGCQSHIVLNIQVKKHKHNTLKLHGAGKNLAKGEASRVLRHLVVENILYEEVKKSDLYGSVSSVLKA